MDKNQIIGWVLIVGIVIGFVAYNSSQEVPIDQQRANIEAFNSKKLDTVIAATKATLKPAPPIVIQTIDSSLTYEDKIRFKIQNEKLKDQYGLFANSANLKADEVIIENNKLRLYINTNGAYVTKAVLKEYRSYEDYHLNQQGELTIFEGEGNSQVIKFLHSNREQSTDAFKFTPSVQKLKVTEGSNSISFTLNSDDGNGKIEYVYTLNADDYLVDFDINMVGLERSILPIEDGALKLEWNQVPSSIEKSISIERQSASVFWHSQADGYDWLGERSQEDSETSEFTTDWISFKQQFFSNILIDNGDGFKNPFMSINYKEEDTTYLKKYHAVAPLKFSASKDNHYDFDLFFGPNDFDLLASIKDGNLELEDEINLGWGIFRGVNQYVLYPIFQFILEYLGVSIGIGIILLTFAIKLLLFPITYKNYLSSAKMRVIKPHLEKLNNENKDADPMKKQQATMALYKKTGVNPLAGCIPALLQMPILIALYRLFPASIELRHQGFLWADDLSSVDDFIQLGFEIPIYGSHISIFTVLMAISMFFYMKFNQQMTPSQSGGGEMQEAIQKNMKMMMNLMPVFMLFMFNNYAAGLSFYYFLANLITIAQTITIKKFIIDEKAILVKIEDQMSKPMTKSRWQKKIDEIQSKQKVKK